MTLADTHFAEWKTSEDRAVVIHDQLRDAIIDRRLAPDTKLSEAEIGSIFDTSRTLVRTALQMLSFEGLVRVERNRGAFVANPSPEEARQVFAARRLIEPALAIGAIERLDATDIAAFKDLLAKETELMAVRGADARRAEIRASGDFHMQLARVSGNAVLEKFLEELVARSSLVIALYGQSGASSCGHGEHQEILDALEQGDASRVGALLVHHIDHIEKDLDLRMRSSQGLKDALFSS